jgi:hypothetical protein
MANENIKNFMLRIPNDLHEQLKTYRVKLATQTNEVVSFHAIILAAIEEKISRA